MHWFLVIVIFLLASIKAEKPKKYQKVSVIIPAFNEEETVARVIEVVAKVPIVDEVIVVNDGSTDGTEKEAIRAGAKVINHDVNKGKGQALHTGYDEAECDIIAFIDADIYNLTSQKVEAMIKPILKGKTDITKTKFARESGRVTELTAKPLLNFFFPEISFEQPLSGQFAARKSVLKKINFETDYGVDVGIVIDADVLGISITEVDIGAIEHNMSPLTDLNLMANEVVRTILNRANKYGRVVMIDDIGYYIRMGIVGLLLIILGLFTIFFVKLVPLSIGVIISVIGLIMAIYYVIKVFVKSITMFRKTPRGNLLRSFVKIHFPMLISVIILLLMISTFIGAAHFENGVLSIEPNSRNLIIYADNTPRDNSISVRGPYTVDTAIENESNIIRIPSDAMMTLGIKLNDTIRIGDVKYTVNEARSGESDIRIPIEARKVLGVQNDDVIQNSRINYVFKASIINHNYEHKNITFYEQYEISSRDKDAGIYEVIVNNKSIANSTGIFKENASYDIAIDGIYYATAHYPENLNFTYSNNTISIIFKQTNSTSFKQFLKQGEGNFINFQHINI